MVEEKNEDQRPKMFLEDGYHLVLIIPRPVFFAMDAAIHLPKIEAYIWFVQS